MIPRDLRRGRYQLGVGRPSCWFEALACCLGTIAYRYHAFDVACVHLEQAAASAGSPGLGDAAEALEWRFQEEG